MTGQLVCRMHGGGKAAAKANGERNIAKQEAAALIGRLLHDKSAPPVGDPLVELAAVMGRIGHAVDVLGERVNGLGDDIEYADHLKVRRLHVLVEAWKDLLIEYRRALTDMAKLDLEGRKDARDQRLVSTFGPQLQVFITAVFTDLGLSEQQQQRAPVVVAHHLGQQLPPGGGGS